MKVAIIGGGLAGTACAYVLNAAGVETAIYEAGDSLAPGASGNALGLYNPRLSALRSPESDYYAAAFGLALRTFADLKDVGWNRCGALHLMTDEQRSKRFAQTATNWGWGAERMRVVDATEASEIAGVELQHGALWLPEAGVVSPHKLCGAYAAQSEVYFGTRVRPADLAADAVILACGMGVKEFATLPLQAVRGQVTQVRATARSKRLQCNLCYGGYFSPSDGREHMIGATFQRWLDHSDILDEDDTQNIAGLAGVAPELAEGLSVTGRRAAVRTTTKDHFPVVGQLAPGLYVSTGHGSHGIISSLAAAHLLAGLITGRAHPLDTAAVQGLSPARFQ